MIKCAVEKTGIYKSRVLVIIPCFNEETNVARLFGEVRDLVIPGFELTPLFINDASRDNTLEKLRALNALHLDNGVNLGIGGTVQLGFMFANENNYDMAVQMDGDGQHPPSELHKILIPLLKGEADVVIGSRFIDNSGFRSTGLRRAGIKIFLWLNKLLAGVDIRDATSGFRAYNSRAIRMLVDYYPDEYPEPEAVAYLAHKKMKLLEVPVIMRERSGGVSSIRRLGSVYYMAKVCLNIIFLKLRMKNG